MCLVINVLFVCVCVFFLPVDAMMTLPFFIANIHVYVLMYPGHGPGISAGVCSIRKVARVCLSCIWSFNFALCLCTLMMSQDEISVII